MNTWKMKFFVLLLAGILSLAFLSGCQSNAPDESSQSIDEVDTGAEYGLYIEDQFYGVNQPCTMALSFPEVEELEKNALEDTVVHLRYTRPGLKMTTFYQEAADIKNRVETPVLIQTTEEGTTPRDIHIGDELSTLKEAYKDELLYSSTFSYQPDYHPVRYNRMYVYAPEDGGYDYLAFYLQDGVIVMMEAGNSYGVRPGYGNGYDNLLGYEKVIIEKDNYYPEQSTTRYFAEDNGSEEFLFEFTSFFDNPPADTPYASYQEIVDLDDDGTFELIVSILYNGSYHETEIYYLKEGKIQCLEVNKALGAVHSLFMDSSTSINQEYPDCFAIWFKNEDGTERKEIYRFKDGTMEFIYLAADNIS